MARRILIGLACLALLGAGFVLGRLAPEGRVALAESSDPITQDRYTGTLSVDRGQTVKVLAAGHVRAALCNDPLGCTGGGARVTVYYTTQGHDRYWLVGR